MQTNKFFKVKKLVTIKLSFQITDDLKYHLVQGFILQEKENNAERSTTKIAVSVSRGIIAVSLKDLQTGET